MHILLYIRQEVVSAYIYVYAEPHERTLFGTRQIRIHHGGVKESLAKLDKPFHHYDNDHVVLFSSTISFDMFYKKFIESDYNNPKKYEFFTHNCADAAYFALKLSGILLPINRLKWTQYSPGTWLKIPTPCLTPFDLYNTAKQYKITQLDQKKLDFKVELASYSLLFWAKKRHDEEVRKHAVIIVSEIRKKMRSRSHHAELYLSTLISAIDKLCGASVTTHVKDLEQFKERRAYWGAKAVTDLANLNITMYSILIISPLINNNLLIPLLGVLLLSISLRATTQLMRWYQEKVLPASLETKLSKSLYTFFGVSQNPSTIAHEAGHDDINPLFPIKS